MFANDDPQMIRLESIPVPTNAQVHVMSKGFWVCFFFFFKSQTLNVH